MGESDDGGILTRGKRVIFAIVAMAIASVLAGGALLATDILLHGRFEKSAGYNVWGYRGPIVGRKQAGEFRVVMTGGSSAYGYGANWDEAIPARLQRRLAAQSGSPATQVVNLGYNNEGAYSFKFTLNDYLWLDYDLAVLYEGYNDLLGDGSPPNTQVFRHESPVYRLTGYLPIFPIVFREKAAALLTAGNVGSAYSKDEKTVFRPGLATRGTAGVLTAVAGVGQALEQQLGRVTTEPARRVEVSSATGCEYPWQSYCQSVLDAVEFALTRNKRVLVVGQPQFALGNARHDRHLAQQHQLAGTMQRQFAGRAEVRYVNLGAVVDLGNPEDSFDGMHLTPRGNAKVADVLAPAVAEMSAREVKQ